MAETSTSLRGLALVCSRKPSSAPSSSALIAEHVFETLHDEDGAAMESTDNDLDEVPEAVASATAAAARNAAHLVWVLQQSQYQPYE